jgi:8-oxo-dGTP pyrophosphatase MutT (NUDIX family)
MATGAYLLPGLKQRLKLASSIIFIRPAAKDKFGSDYEILMLKRNPNLNAFAGFYAFPGGNQDNPGDTFENWKTNYPEFVAGNENLGFRTDFSKRIAAVRESFEEINYLLADG